MAQPTRFAGTRNDATPNDAPNDDTADWLDWDHWQGVDEYQDIVDGLGGPPLDDSAEGGEAADETDRRRLRRHLHRRGIELEH